VEFIEAFTTVTIFALMLTIGVNESFKELSSLWRRSAVLLRLLFAAIVLVPAMVMVMLLLFDMPPAVATGLALLAAAPGAPLTTTRAKIAGADLSYVSSLQLALALLAVVATPLWLAIYYSVLDLTIEAIGPTTVASQVARVTFLPVVIGLLLHHFAPAFTARIRKPLNIFAAILFPLLVLLIVVATITVAELRNSFILEPGSFAAVLTMVVAALAIGHLMGGRQPEERGGLAIACIARNFGLAVYIATLSEAGAASIPAMTVYLVLGAVTGIGYGLWNRRQVASKQET
jgi:BASS family bile acid:Na+ symporter